MLLFSQKKASEGEKIILNEAEKQISDDKKIWTIFNNFFSNVASDLKMPNHYNYFSQKNKHSFSTIVEMIEKYPSIFNIKKRILIQFFIQKVQVVTQEDVSKGIPDLKTKKKKVIKRVTLQPKLSN